MVSTLEAKEKKEKKETKEKREEEVDIYSMVKGKYKLTRSNPKWKPVKMTVEKGKYKTIVKFSGCIDCKNKHVCPDSIMKPGKTIPKQYCPPNPVHYVQPAWKPTGIIGYEYVSVQIGPRGNIYIRNKREEDAKLIEMVSFDGIYYEIPRSQL